jgi:hypothetical protein
LEVQAAEQRNKMDISNTPNASAAAQERIIVDLAAASIEVAERKTAVGESRRTRETNQRKMF